MPGRPQFLRFCLTLALAFAMLAPCAVAQNEQPAAQPEAQHEVQPDIQPGAQTPAQPEAQPQAQPREPALLDGLRPARAGDPVTEDDLIPLGSIDPDSGHEIFVRFSRYGAGVFSLQLTNSYSSVSRAADQHVEIQAERETRDAGVTPFSVETVIIEGRPVRMQAVFDPLSTEQREMRIWSQSADDPGLFTARVENGEGLPILEIQRRYTVESGSRTLRVDQSIRNLTAVPLRVRVVEVGPVDPPQIARYPSDTRRVRFAHIEATGELRINPSLRSRGDAMGTLGSKFVAERTLWPLSADAQAQRRLSWFAVTNRFFAVAVRPAPSTNDDPQPTLLGADSVERTVLRVGDSVAASTMILRAAWPDQRIEPGQTADRAFAVYAGPLEKRLINAEPGARAILMGDLVVYNYGGMCGFCTFSWLTAPLVALLRTIHDYLVFDWAIAIIILVLIVRTLLHPVTRWSQIRVQLFTKQMQDIGPKQKKLQERYKGDPETLRRETMALYREEGVSPAGMLGCLPMFLQTPVWVALYASLFFAYEMRQSPAFYGAFQNFGGWAFMADLSEPDRFISLGAPLFSLPMFGDFASLNIMPLLLGFVFYAHQKFLAPPSGASMTPEQQTQQKIIRIVSVVLFPVLMYNAPSGLAIYFVANSTIAIFENKWIRASAEKQGLLDLEKRKRERKRKGPGMIARAMQAAEQRRAMKRGDVPQPPPGSPPIHRPGFRPGHEPDLKKKKGGGKPPPSGPGFKKRK